MGTGALTPGLKRPEREADQWPPFIVEVKNDGAYLHSPIGLHGVVLNYLSTGTTLPSFCFSSYRRHNQSSEHIIEECKYNYELQTLNCCPILRCQAGSNNSNAVTGWCRVYLIPVSRTETQIAVFIIVCGVLVWQSLRYFSQPGTATCTPHQT
jgi:hypothetical protein